MAKRPSQREQKHRQSRVRQRTRPPDWTEWDTRQDLLRAEEYERLARHLLKRRTPAPELIVEHLEAAEIARALGDPTRRSGRTQRPVGISDEADQARTDQ